MRVTSAARPSGSVVLTLPISGAGTPFRPPPFHSEALTENGASPARSPGHGHQDRNRTAARQIVDIGILSGRKEVDGLDLLLRKRIVPDGHIGADLIRHRIRPQNAGCRVAEERAVPPVADIAARDQHVVIFRAVGVVDPVAARIGSLPGTGVQEKEPRQLRVDRNAVDPGRELGFFGAAHDQAGLSVVLRRIDDAEGDAVHLLQAGRHVAEVVLTLAGPAGSVTVVAETAVRLLREVDRIFAPFRNRPVHRAELERHDLFVRFAAGEHVVEDVSQVSRS